MRRLLGDAARQAVWQLLDVQRTERRIDDPAAVRRHLRPAQLLDCKFIGRDDLGHPQRVTHFAGVHHPKGNFGGRAFEGIHPPNLALGPDDDGLGVRRPGESRVDAVHRPRLLQIAFQMRPHRRLGAGVQVFQEEGALAAFLVAKAAHKGEVLAIGRGRRPDRTARALHKGFNRTITQILPKDLENFLVRVFVVLEHPACRRVLRVVEELAVRRQGGLAEIFLPVGLFVELNALVRRGHAVGVIEPDLARAGRACAGVMLARGDVLAVGVPDRVVEQPVVFLGDRAGRVFRAVAVSVHDPYVVAATSIADEGDLLAIR